MKFDYPEHLKKYVGSIKSAPIQDGRNKTIGWSTVVLGPKSSGSPSLASGTGPSQLESLRVAVAESIEFLEFNFGLSAAAKATVRMEEYPTRCGLAVGFEPQSTRLRSLAEALERWAWSKWIDDGYVVSRIAEPQLSALATHYSEQFKEVLFFEKSFPRGVLGIGSPLKFCAVIGVLDGGAYPGSRVCTEAEEPWDHALVEAWRHRKIFETLEKRESIYPILKERLKYFSTHGGAATRKATEANSHSWPDPEIEFSVQIRSMPEYPYFMYRSICKNFQPWHIGPASRFIF